jgi:thiol-disulfide isomerase/thioredoxin
MRRLSFACLLVAGVIGASHVGVAAMAQDGTLKVGDPAPPLAVSRWLHGAEVKQFEPGRVYVVEFWATWCGPCIQMMPHLGDLQDEYRNKGVTIIGFASEANDKEEKINTYVAKHGAKLGYTFALGNGTETHTAYMRASGQAGIPCSFVVDQKGKIAYIGHPFFLDFVLPKVLDGTWDQKATADTITTADKEFDAAYAIMMTPTNSPEAGLKAMAEYGAKWPMFAHNAYMISQKLGLLVRAKKFDEAKELGEKLISKAVARGDSSGLRGLSASLRDDAAKGHADLTALAVKAAEAAYDVDQNDVATLLKLVEAYGAAGDQAKVKEFGPKAVAAAKAAIEGQNDAVGTITVAAAYFAAGDKEKAKATAESAIKMVEPANAGMRRYIEQQAKKYGAAPQNAAGKSER